MLYWKLLFPLTCICHCNLFSSLVLNSGGFPLDSHGTPFMVPPRMWGTPRVYFFVEHIRYLGWAKPSMEVGRVRSLLGLVLTRVPLPNPLQRAIVECFNQFPRLCSLLRSSRIIYSLLFNFLNKMGEMYALKVD